MKKLIIPVLALAMYLSGQSLAASTHTSEEVNIVLDHNNEFEKSKDQTWPGKDNVWYKIDKNAKLWWSKDGKKWEASKDGLWQDADGKWLKIGDKKLWWSADEGKTWAEVPEWQWQGSDSKWYKFDKTWSLWVKQA